MKKWHYIVIPLLSLLIAGLVAADRWLRPLDLAREQAAARAAGIPLSPAEFDRPRPPAEEDAAPEWIELTALLEEKPFDKVLVRSAANAMKERGAPSAAKGAALRRFVDARPEVLSRIHAIVRKRQAYFPHALQPPEFFPYYGVMREGAQLLRAESALMADAGRYDDAVRNQALAFRIVNHAASDPTLIGYIVAIAIDLITVEGLEGILAEAGPDARVAAAVRSALERNPSPFDLDLALKGAALAGVTAIRSMTPIRDATHSLNGPAGAPAGAPVPSHRRPDVLTRRYVTDPGEATYLHWMTRAIRAAREPEARRLAALARVRMEGEASLQGYNPSDTLPAVLLPTVEKAAARELHVTARRRVLLAAARVMEYRSVRGRWPARLTDAMPDPPLDPFTGKSILYERTGKGFMVRTGAKPSQLTAAASKLRLEFRYP